MKKFLLSSALFLISFIGFSQTKGISYQAVIIDPNPIQIPGSDITAQPYVSKDVWIRFGIYAGSTLQYEELHKTKTDEYGLVNLIIGAGVNTGKAGTFTSLSWDGITKSIITNVSFDQGGRYTEVSNQKLNYVPYTLLAETAVKLAGVLPIASGGTGATNAIAARTNLGLGNVDNTADVDKPVSIATLAILDTKEAIANKSTNIIADSASSVKYPTVKAIKDYIDSRNSLSAQQANQANRANLAAKATALETPRTINGVPFDGTANITIPVGVTPPDANATTKGLVQLAGDLTGTAAAPAIAANSVTTAKIIDGAVTTGKLAAGAVNTAQVADGAITNAKITSVAGSKVTGNIAGNAGTATKLAAPKNINGVPFDGSSDITISASAATLSGTIAVANGGTGSSTAAGARTNLGLVIGTDVLAQRTFGTAANSSATDFVAATEKGANNGVATLGNNGKIPSTQIPAISFQNVNVVNSDAAMIGIAGAQVGSIAIRTDNNNNYVLSALPASTLSNWIALATPLYVSTVNGYAGPNVVLTTNDVAEGNANKYFTDAHARAALSATGPLSYNSTTGNFSMTAASTTSNGYLSSADFTTFNNKQTALTAGVDYATPSGNITGNAANVTGIVSIANGGTGTSTATGALVALGAEPSANKSNDVDGDGSSITKFPTVKSIKDYVDRQSANAGVADNSITSAKINGTIAIAKGGTGASTAAGARTNLGLVIGTDVMAANATTALTGDVSGSGNGSFATTVNSVGGVSSSTIATLPGLITTNTTAVAANTASITANSNSIATLNTNVAANTASITANTTSIATLNTNVAANTVSITANETAIASNTSSITANTNAIAANTVSITANSNDLALKAPLASPAFTGTPTAPTPATSDNSTKVATTEYVKNSIVAANAGLSSIGAISATSNAKGATISGTTELILTPADATNGGIVTTGAQTFVGAKTFTNTTIFGTDITVNGLTVGKGGGNISSNTAIGSGALALNSSGSGSTAFGYKALSKSTAGYATAFGTSALENLNTGTANVAIGYAALNQTSSQNSNTAVGDQAMRNSTGANNTVLGASALSGVAGQTNGNNNTALGTFVLRNATTAAFNVGVGSNSLNNLTTGNDNTVLGYLSGYYAGAGTGTTLTNMSQGVLLGSNVRTGTNTSTNEIAIGYNVVGNGSNTVTIGNNSITANYFRGDINLTGNILGGIWSGTAISAAKGGTGLTSPGASGNVLTSDGTNWVSSALPVSGVSTLAYSTTAAANGGTISGTTLTLAAANGSNPGLVSTGAQTFAGAKTFSSDATISGITVGVGTGSQASNAVLGKTAMTNNTTGNNTVAVGFEALKANTISNYNTAVGSTALSANNNADANTAVGFAALTASQSGGYNTAVGSNSLAANVSGGLNTGLGNTALYTNTSGGYNTAVGNKALFSNVTGSYNTAIGHDADVASSALTNATAIGNGAVVSASNRIQLGNANVTSVVTSGTISATGFTGPLTGNASTATKLAATKNINGIAFDGSADITIAADANTLTGTTLASNVTASSLTSVGTITSGIWSATTIDIAKGGTGATTAAAALTNLGAQSVDNMSTNITTDAASIAKYPSVKLIKDYVDGRVASAGVSDGSITNVKLANSTTILGSTTMTLGGTVSSVTGLTSLEATNLTGTLSGTATALATGRTISTTGDVTYTSGAFDGTSNVTGSATLTNTAVTAGNYGSSTAIPTFTVDSKGRLTAAGTVGITAGVSTLAYSTTGSSNGGTISGTTLTLTAADATNPGLISTGTQTIAGAKTFSNTTTFNSDIVLNGITIGKGSGGVSKNLAVGISALNTNTLSPDNTAIGYQALKAFSEQNSTTGYGGNTAVGSGALGSTTTGNQNTAVGASALLSNTSGGLNAAFGVQALNSNTSGLYNSAIGASALYQTSSGGENTALGKSSGYTNTTGTKNTFLGASSDAGSSALTNATAIGYGATVSASNSIQLGNTSVTNVKTNGTLTAGSVTYPKLAGTAGQVLTDNGSGALYWSSSVGSLGTFTTTSYASGGTISGSNIILAAADASNPGLISTGTQTIAGAKTFTNTATFNTDISVNGLTVGRGAGAVASNAALGATALNANTSGNYNVAVGSEALQRNTTGSVNVALGAATIDYLTSGNNNTVVGGFAGRNYGPNGGATGNNTTMNNGILLGYDARPLASGGTDEVVIGMRAIGNGSNTVTLGNSSNTKTFLTGDLSLTGSITSGVWSSTVISSNKGGAGSVNGLLKANGSGVVTAAVAGTDYQAPLTAGTSFIAPNAAITAATKTKITYDAFGLVTAGADATTADIAPSTNRNYVTDAQAGVISNTSGTNTGDETASTIKTKLGIATLSGSNTGDQTIILTGDVTGTGTGSFAATLTNTTVTAGTYGSSTAIPTFMVDSKGRLTAASTSSIVADANTLTGTTLASNVVNSSLTSVGTITTGVWSGTAIAIAKGGTGATTKSAAFDALSPMSTSGDIIYGGASGTGTRLAKGTDGQVLTLASGLPSWATPAGITALAAIGSSANANGASISGTTLNLEPASSSFGGIVTTGTQTFAGDKTFSSDIITNEVRVGKGVAGNTTNTVLGKSALTATSTVTNENIHNTAIGISTMQNGSATGSYNTSVGSNSGFWNSSGSDNTNLGYQSGYNITTGSKNIAIGSKAMLGVAGSYLTGAGNNAIGFEAMKDISTTAADNIAIGLSAGTKLTTGTKNIFIGSLAGSSISTGSSANTTGLNSVMIGYDVRPLANGDRNEIVISGFDGTAGTVGLGSNTTLIGSSTTTDARIMGALNLPNTTASTTTTTGALTVAGGVGIAGAANIGGITTITNATASTSSTSGALKVAGGAGIAGALNVGGNTVFTGTIEIDGGTPGAGKVLVSDANGLASWSANSNGGVSSITASATMAATDNYNLIVFSGSTASQVITLPSAVTVGPGREITIKNIASVTVGVASTAGNLISDSTTTTATSLNIGIEPSNNWIKAISNGTNWIILRALF